MFIDSSQSGYLTKSQLFEGLRRTLEIFLSDQDLNILTSLLDPRDSNAITLDQFTSKISLKAYLEQIKDERLTVSKSHFLSILIDMYNRVQIKDAALITSLFQNYHKVKINQEDFSQIFMRLDPKFIYEMCEFYYNEALMDNMDASLDGVTLDALIKCVFKHAIGRRGVRDFSN